MKKQVKVLAPRVLGRDEILARHRVATKQVEVPGWGGVVNVRPPAFPEIIALKTAYPDEVEFKLALVIKSCVDLQDADFQALREGNGFVFSELVNAVLAAVGEGGGDLGN